MWEALKSLLPYLGKMPDWLKACLLMAALFLLLNQQQGQTADLKAVVSTQGTALNGAQLRIAALETELAKANRELELVREDIRRMEGKVDIIVQRGR